MGKSFVMSLAMQMNRQNDEIKKATDVVPVIIAEMAPADCASTAMTYPNGVRQLNGSLRKLVGII